jgi:putative transposase
MKDSFKPSLDRKSLRLPHFDYSQAGLYFVTIVTQKRACLFGSIINGEMILNEAGRMVDEVCCELPQFIHTMDWVIYQIMPNHFHAIIELKNLGVDQLISPVGATLCEALFEPWLPRVALSAKRSSS